MSARTIVEARGGRWHGNNGQMRCPVPSHGRGHGDRHPSLSIRDDPTNDVGIIVHCHTGCDWRDVKGELRRLGLIPDWKGDTGKQSVRRRRRQHVRQSQNTDCPTSSGSSPSVNNTRFAREIWQQTKDAGGTIVQSYLQSRGITVPLPPTIRFHPALRHRDTRLIHPAMVAAVTRVFEHTLCGIHRTYLTSDGTGKATDCEPKMMLGPCRGGAVRLATPSDLLMVGEGIETCLAAMQATGNPAWAALSTSGLRALDLPESVREVIVLADGDDPGEAAARDCAMRWQRERRRVRIARPPRGQDFNDLLTGHAPRDGEGRK